MWPRVTRRCSAFMRPIEQQISLLVNHGPDTGPVLSGSPGVVDTRSRCARTIEAGPAPPRAAAVPAALRDAASVMTPELQPLPRAPRCVCPASTNVRRPVVTDARASLTWRAFRWSRRPTSPIPPAYPGSVPPARQLNASGGQDHEDDLPRIVPRRQGRPPASCSTVGRAMPPGSWSPTASPYGPTPPTPWPSSSIPPTTAWGASATPTPSASGSRPAEARSASAVADQALEAVHGGLAHGEDRAARELKDGDYVSLGIGLPTPCCGRVAEPRSKPSEWEPGICAQVPRLGGHQSASQDASVPSADRLLTRATPSCL
ncbi:hypothetical protein ACVW19_006232 [Streptomyces sp. TE5632]